MVCVETEVWFDDDLYRYIFLSKIHNLGLDPYVVVPSEFAGNFALQSIVKWIGYPDVPSVYPPLAHTIWGYLGSHIGYQLTNWQIFNGILCLVTFFLCLVSCLLFAPFRYSSLLFYIFQPVFIIDFANGGHLDLYCVFAFCAHLVCLTALFKQDAVVSKKLTAQTLTFLSTFLLGAFVNLRPTFLMIYIVFYIYLMCYRGHFGLNRGEIFWVAVFFVLGCLLGNVLPWVQYDAFGGTGKLTGAQVYKNYQDNLSYFGSYWVFFPLLTDVIAKAISCFRSIENAWADAIMFSYFIAAGIIMCYGSIKWYFGKFSPNDVFVIVMTGIVFVPVVNSWYFSFLMVTLCMVKKEERLAPSYQNQMASLLVFPLFTKLGILFWVNQKEPVLVFKIFWLLWIRWAIPR